MVKKKLANGTTVIQEELTTPFIDPMGIQSLTVAAVQEVSTTLDEHEVRIAALESVKRKRRRRDNLDEEDIGEFVDATLEQALLSIEELRRRVDSLEEALNASHEREARLEALVARLEKPPRAPRRRSQKRSEK